MAQTWDPALFPRQPVSSPSRDMCQLKPSSEIENNSKSPTFRIWVQRYWSYDEVICMACLPSLDSFLGCCALRSERNLRVWFVETAVSAIKYF